MACEAVNLRYRKWIEDKRQPGLQDLSERERCFGWAKYVHEARRRGVGSLLFTYEDYTVINYITVIYILTCYYILL